MNAECQSCPLCGALDNLLRCSRCKGTYYCSKEHQRLHWNQHRRQCRHLVQQSQSERVEQQMSTVDQNGVAVPVRTPLQSESQEPASCPGIDRLSSQYAHLTTRTSNGLPAATSGSERRAQSNCTASPPPYLHRSPRLVPSEMPTTNSLWMQTMCQYVIRDMDRYGICVIDNFVGYEVGGAIVDEVVTMYGNGGFMDGKLVGTPSGNSSQTIRGDKIAWVDGSESGCSNIGYLIRLVDAIVINSNKMPRNGKLGQYVISDRTRAMVACYPGQGSQYVKHVDNPNKDGRCITCIYYLNKDWDVKKDGGLLRIFPKGWTSSVADIDPAFDRILLFWSDRRNPHEVQPSLRTRYAITLWYYDKLEREAARQLCPDDRRGTKRKWHS